MPTIFQLKKDSDQGYNFRTREETTFQISDHGSVSES